MNADNDMTRRSAVAQTRGEVDEMIATFAAISRRLLAVATAH
jgi:hypothetical protein